MREEGAVETTWMVYVGCHCGCVMTCSPPRNLSQGQRAQGGALEAAQFPPSPPGIHSGWGSYLSYVA